MKIIDMIVGLLGVSLVTAALLYVKMRHANDPILSRPKDVPKDAGHYGATNDWIRCLNTNDATVFDCEIYTESGELIHKGVYTAPDVPTLPLIIQGQKEKTIAVKDQVGHRFELRPKL